MSRTGRIDPFIDAQMPVVNNLFYQGDKLNSLERKVAIGKDVQKYLKNVDGGGNRQSLDELYENEAPLFLKIINGLIESKKGQQKDEVCKKIYETMVSHIQTIFGDEVFDRFCLQESSKKWLDQLEQYVRNFIEVKDGEANLVALFCQKLHQLCVYIAHDSDGQKLDDEKLLDALVQISSSVTLDACGPGSIGAAEAMLYQLLSSGIYEEVKQKIVHGICYRVREGNHKHVPAFFDVIAQGGVQDGDKRKVNDKYFNLIAFDLTMEDLKRVQETINLRIGSIALKSMGVLAKEFIDIYYKNKRLQRIFDADLIGLLESDLMQVRANQGYLDSLVGILGESDVSEELQEYIKKMMIDDMVLEDEELSADENPMKLLHDKFIKILKDKGIYEGFKSVYDEYLDLKKQFLKQEISEKFKSNKIEISDGNLEKFLQEFEVNFKKLHKNLKESYSADFIDEESFRNGIEDLPSASASLDASFADYSVVGAGDVSFEETFNASMGNVSICESAIDEEIKAIINAIPAKSYKEKTDKSRFENIIFKNIKSILTKDDSPHSTDCKENHLRMLDAIHVVNNYIMKGQQVPVFIKNYIGDIFRSSVTNNTFCLSEEAPRSEEYNELLGDFLEFLRERRDNKRELWNSHPCQSSDSLRAERNLFVLQKKEAVESARHNGYLFGILDLFSEELEDSFQINAKLFKRYKNVEMGEIFCKEDSSSLCSLIESGSGLEEIKNMMHLALSTYDPKRLQLVLGVKNIQDGKILLPITGLVFHPHRVEIINLLTEHLAKIKLRGVNSEGEVVEIPVEPDYVQAMKVAIKLGDAKLISHLGIGCLEDLVVKMKDSPEFFTFEQIKILHSCINQKEEDKDRIYKVFKELLLLRDYGDISQQVSFVSGLNFSEFLDWAKNNFGIKFTIEILSDDLLRDKLAMSIIRNLAVKDCAADLIQYVMNLASDFSQKVHGEEEFDHIHESFENLANVFAIFFQHCEESGRKKTYFDFSKFLAEKKWSEYNLVRCYICGIGVDQDLVKAKQMIRDFLDEDRIAEFKHTPLFTILLANISLREGDFEGAKRNIVEAIQFFFAGEDDKFYEKQYRQDFIKELNDFFRLLVIEIRDKKQSLEIIKDICKEITAQSEAGGNAKYGLSVLYSALLEAVNSAYGYSELEMKEKIGEEVFLEEKNRLWNELFDFNIELFSVIEKFSSLLNSDTHILSDDIEAQISILRNALKVLSKEIASDNIIEKMKTLAKSGGNQEVDEYIQDVSKKRESVRKMLKSIPEKITKCSTDLEDWRQRLESSEQIDEEKYALACKKIEDFSTLKLDLIKIRADFNKFSSDFDKNVSKINVPATNAKPSEARRGGRGSVKESYV